MAKRLKFVTTETTRHGKTVYYFRRSKDHPRVRLPDDPSAAEFLEQYQKALGAKEHLVPPTGHYLELAKRRMAMEQAVKRLVYQARVRARKKNIECDLTTQWAVERLRNQQYKCLLTGIYFDFSYTTGGFMRPFGPSIDKIDPRGAYTQGNSRIIVAAVNVMMSDWGAEVFEQVVRGYRREKKRKSNRYVPHQLPKIPHRKKTVKKQNVKREN